MTLNEDPTKKTLNIAHRGASSIAPENTLIAARKAYRSGADVWELDVQLTRDNRLVVIHDDTLTRTTNVEEVYPDRNSYRVTDFTLGEIKTLDAGSWFGEEDPFGEIAQGTVTMAYIENYQGITVPTLRQALELTETLGWRVNIEVKSVDKSGNPEDKPTGTLTDKVVSLVKKLGMEEEVIVSSFNHSLVRSLRELSSRIRGGILVEEIDPEPVETLHFNRATFYGIPYSTLAGQQGEEILKKINNAGDEYQVIVWTVNESERLKDLVSNSLVGGITTDYPQRLATLVDEVA